MFMVQSGDSTNYYSRPNSSPSHNKANDDIINKYVGLSCHLPNTSTLTISHSIDWASFSLQSGL